MGVCKHMLWILIDFHAKMIILYLNGWKKQILFFFIASLIAIRQYHKNAPIVMQQPMCQSISNPLVHHMDLAMQQLMCQPMAHPNAQPIGQAI